MGRPQEQFTRETWVTTLYGTRGEIVEESDSFSKDQSLKASRLYFEDALY